MRRSNQRRVRRHERGAASVETAVSLILLTFLLVVLIHFGHAMLVRHRLTNATTTAARVCALGDPADAEACARQTIEGGLGNSMTSCRTVDVSSQDANLNDIEVLRVDAACDYIGVAGGRFLAQYLDGDLNLTAQAVMPRR